MLPIFDTAMQALAPPSEVTAAATAALTVTAMHWGFSPTGAAAAVMDKCEERLPQIFGSTLLGKLGKILCGVWPSASAAIWSHVKVRQLTAPDPSVLMRHDSDDMDGASAAWAAHYRQSAASCRTIRWQARTQRRRSCLDGTEVAGERLKFH